MVDVPKITIITPTIRPEGLPIVEKALRRQVNQNFEWLVCSPFKPNITRGRHVVDPFKDGIWTLNRVYNLLIKESNGDLIVSWQDYTFADPDCIDKFALHFKQEPNTLVTAVGNKYSDEKFLAQTWQDPRERSDYGSYYECYPHDIEANLCSIPKKALIDVGGFDEQMDFEGYGYDARGVFERLDYLGEYNFKIDQSIKSYSLTHGRVKDWDENNMMNKWFDYKAKQFDTGRYPVLPYLTKE